MDESPRGPTGTIKTGGIRDTQIVSQNEGKMARLSFASVQAFAKSKGLNIQKINYTCEGRVYRYEVFKSGALVIDCETLKEAYSELYYWNENNG